MTSRERALQCAAAMPKMTLFHNWCDPRVDEYVARFGLSTSRFTMRLLSIPFLDQLDRCADDSSRRLLLGIGEPFEGTREARG